jgi:DNA-binding SARP family transcriptional activator
MVPVRWGAVRFRLLGPVEIDVAGEVLSLPRRRDRCLLGVLLLSPNRVVPVDRIAELLWDGEPPENARRVIHGAVSRIRARLRTDGQTDRAEVVRVDDGYRLVVDPQAVDAYRFQALLREARGITDAADLVRPLRAALDLWRGPALADAAGDWTRDRLCAELTEQHLTATEDFLAASLALGRARDVLPELARLAGAHPGRESVIALQMRALYQADRRVEALAVFDRARAYLADEFGLDPGPTLRELHQAILRDQLAAPDPSFRLGPPPPGGMRRVVPPCQLPADVAGFVGRTRQLDQLDALLPAAERVAPAGGISVISGIAGIGKTALSVHWGHRVREQFGDGQLYADLRGFARERPTAPIQVLARFLHALGLPAEMVPTELEEASAMYRSLLAQKRVLVVLDNAVNVDQVRPLLPGAGGCVVVVTSRNHLGGLVAYEGAQHVALGAMAEEDSIALLIGLLGADRVQAAPDTAAELANGCAYLPLALRIAAANLQRRPYLSLAAYAAELRGYGRLAKLEVPGDAQATVRGAFDLSCARLVEPAQRMLRLLGLVPGPDFTAPVAAALADATLQQAGRLLEVLVDANLVAEHSEDRFALHDLLKAYAAERCEQEETEAARRAARDRLYAYLLHHTSGAADLLYPHMLRLPTGQGAGPSSVENQFDDHAAALAWLDQERANLVAAVTDATERGAHATAWRLADALRGYLLMRLHLVEGLTVASAALDSAETDHDLNACAMAHLSHASCLWRLNRTPEAIEQLTRALELSRSAGWLQCQSAVLGNLGVLFAENGRQDEAIDQFRQALALHEQTGRRQGQATVLGNLANIYYHSGRLSEAAEHAARAQAVNGEIGSRDGEASNLVIFAEVHRLSGHFQAATAAARKALDLQRSIGNRTGEADALRCLSETACDSEQYALAQQLAAAALAVGQDIGSVRIEADALAAGATARLQQGDVTGASEDYRRAAELIRDGNQYTAAEALVGLAAARSRDGESSSARRWADKAVERARRAGFRLLEGRALTAMAEIELADGHARQATEYGEQALTVHSQIGYRLGEAKACVVLSHAHRRSGNAIVAGRTWQRALALYADLGLPGPPTPPGMGEVPATRR